jgi:putative membrane protein
LVAFSLLGSLITQLTGLEAGFIRPLTGFLMILTGVGAIVQAFAYHYGWPKAWISLGLLLIIGLVSELVGLYSGYPFGMYRYTGEWWPSIGLTQGHSFPLLLPFAWYLVAGCTYLYLCQHIHGPFWSAIVAGLAAALVDLFMEPVMTGVLNYWVWLDPEWPIGGPLLGGAPYLNAVGWFGTTVVASIVLYVMGARGQEDEPQFGLVVGAFLLFVLLLWGISSLPQILPG